MNIHTKEVLLDNGNKITITYRQEAGYAITDIYLFRVGPEQNKRQDLLDIIEECQKELEVMYENDEK